MTLTVTTKVMGVTKTRGQVFDAFVEGRKIVSRSTTPFLDACRQLMAEGADPKAKVVMRHEGADHDALRSTIGYAAKLTVKDNSVGAPVFAKWVPFAAPISPPMHSNEVPGRVMAPDPENVS